MEPAVIELEGFSARTVELVPASATATGTPEWPLGEDHAIESDRIRVEAVDDGTLTVLDKETGRRLEGLHRLEDELDMGDLYNFCPVEGTATWRSGGFDAVRILRNGPVVWELEVRVVADRPAGLDPELRPRPDQAPLTVATVVRLGQGAGRVEFRTTVDNATEDHRLRVAFPVGRARVGTARVGTPPVGTEHPDGAEHPGEVRAEGQFALVRRPLAPPAPRTDWVEPPDATQHTLGAVALGPLALLTKGLPEYEARTGEAGAELCLTLLRAVGLISRPSGAIATRPLGAGPQTPTPEGQCLGRHELEYALLPGADSLDDAALLRAAQDYRYGFLVTQAGAGVHFDSALSVQGDVVFSCLKGAEDGDGLILRVFNPKNTAASARIGVAGEFIVSRTRLDETGDQPVDGGALVVAPGEIATVRLRRA
jgi:mannosylglycerate hydrolase